MVPSLFRSQDNQGVHWIDKWLNRSLARAIGCVATSRKKSPRNLSFHVFSSQLSGLTLSIPNSSTPSYVLLILFPKVTGQDGEQYGSTGACRDAHFQPEIYRFADGDSLLRQGDATHA